jgi:hypothetical protein
VAGIGRLGPFDGFSVRGFVLIVLEEVLVYLQQGFGAALRVVRWDYSRLIGSRPRRYIFAASRHIFYFCRGLRPRSLGC